MNNKLKVGMTGLAAVHLVVTFCHGGAHQLLAVDLPPEKNAFVFLVIIVAPIAGTLLAWARQVRAGVWIFFLSMLAAFLFGVYHHFVVVSDDHVQHLPAGSANVQAAFIASAAALALLEFVSTVYAWLCLVRLGKRSATAGG